MGVVLRDEAFDGAAARNLRAAFASEIGSLYPGWHPSVGPSAEPDEFRSAGYSDIADYNGNLFASHWLEKRLPRA